MMRKKTQRQDSCPATKRKLYPSTIGLVCFAFFLGLMINLPQLLDQPRFGVVGCFITAFLWVMTDFMRHTRVNGSVVPRIDNKWAALYYGRKSLALFVFGLILLFLIMLAMWGIFDEGLQFLLDRFPNRS